MGLYTLGLEDVSVWSQIQFSINHFNALVNVNSQGPPMGNPGDSDRVYLTHTGESDKNILTEVNSDPNMKELLHILAFFIYFLSIPTHSPRDFLTGNSLSVCPSHAPVLVFV